VVAKTASPDYAALMGKVKGIITDIGSVASHLASVAREFGVPDIFDAGRATSSLGGCPRIPGLSVLVGAACSRDWPIAATSRSLRINFLASVLGSLGFTVTITGSHDAKDRVRSEKQGDIWMISVEVYTG
jgi:hypothetical protein